MLDENFTMRISPQERRMLADVARHFQRNQSDTIRVLIRTIHRNLQEEQQAAIAQTSTKAQPEPA